MQANKFILQTQDPDELIELMQPGSSVTRTKEPSPRLRANKPDTLDMLANLLPNLLLGIASILQIIWWIGVIVIAIVIIAKIFGFSDFLWYELYEFLHS